MLIQVAVYLRSTQLSRVKFGVRLSMRLRVSGATAEFSSVHASLTLRQSTSPFDLYECSKHGSLHLIQGGVHGVTQDAADAAKAAAKLRALL